LPSPRSCETIVRVRGGWGNMRILRAIFTGRALFFLTVLCSTLGAERSFAFFCHAPADVCRHIQFCLDKLTDDNRTFRDRIIYGLKTQSGGAIWDGTEQCQGRFGQPSSDASSWQHASASCSDQEFVDQGHLAERKACDPRVHWLCVRNGDGQYLGTLGLDCRGEFQNGSQCTCEVGSGHVLRQVQP
jgi:hypothetical protein